MKQIPLRKRNGELRAYALVDDADFEHLSQWSWSLKEGPHGHRYAQRTDYAAGRSILMHRQIMNFPAVVDHRNGDGLDNRRPNLRCSTRTRNAQNRRGPDRDNASGYRGVSRARGRRNRTCEKLVQSGNLEVVPGGERTRPQYRITPAGRQFLLSTAQIPTG